MLDEVYTYKSAAVGVGELEIIIWNVHKRGRAIADPALIFFSNLSPY